MKLRKNMRKVSDKQKEKNKKKAEETRKLHDWFLQLWDEREELGFSFRGELQISEHFVRCFETGRKLSRETFRENTACYSHILAKSKHPELAMVAENVVIVSPESHEQYELNPNKTPNQKALREKLKEKYDKHT